MNFFSRRKQRKRLQALMHHARGMRHMREDVLPAAELSALDADLQAALQAYHTGDGPAMMAADKALVGRIGALTPSCSFPEWRENFEVLVVALGVAMAFRAYFYQPFQIPTGSMQPTLYGISSREQLEAPGRVAQPLLKLPNWLITGEWFQRMETQRTGKVAVLWGDDRVPGYTTVVSGHWRGDLPPEELYHKESMLARKLYGIGSHLGIGLLDRGFDLFFLPNDVTARHAGIYRSGYLPPAAVQARVADALRKQIVWLTAAAENADPETRSMALQNVYPVVATIANWSRGGVLDESSLQAVLRVYEACEARRRGRTPDPVLEQRACADLLRAYGAWADAAAAGSPAVPWFPLLSGYGIEIPAGQLLWSGVVTEGDFVFVNRWIWNFRLPRRGEVMVFSTRDIRGLPDGTHYIKRMCGLPGETLSIHPPELWIDGRAVYEPSTIGRVARREQLAPWAPPYAGYRVVDGNVDARYPRALHTPTDSVHLAVDEYFAMGDNTPNSLDGRYWGPVPRRNLLGPASVVYWPFTSKRWGRIE